MKKFIAIALMLAMCLAMFAGCNNNSNTTTAPSEDGFDNAKALLLGMYKDKDGSTTSTDYDVVGSVMIGDISYEIEWTVDNDAVTITKGSNNMVTIDVPDPTEEEVNYVLTATIKSADGKTQSYTFSCKVPAVEKADVSDGDKIVIYNPGDAVYATGVDYVYTSSSGSQKHQLELSSDKADALVLSILTNDDGTVSFITDDGKYLYADGTNVQLVDEQGDHTLYVLEPGEGGQYIKCANATYNDKPQYLEIYSGYLTCYNFNAEKANLYAFELQDAEGAGSSSTESDSTEPDTTTPVATTPVETTPVATTPVETTPVTTAPSTNNNTGATVTDGAKVVIYNPGDGIYATANGTTYTSSSGNTKDELETSSSKSDAVVLTIKDNGSTISFVTGDGKYLYADGNNVKLTAEASEYTEFVLETADGGYYIRCATATYYEKAQYLEIYSGYLTCYGMGTNTSLYVFELQAA